MRSLQTSLFFAAVLGFLALCGSVWGVESSESIQGLISHWKFDEGSGTTAYDSAGNNDGTVYGAQWTTGQINGALSFDGVDDYVNLSENAITTTEFTIAAWANQYGEGGGVENQNIIFSQRDDDVGDNRPIIGLHADNGLSYACAGIRSDSGSAQVLRVPKKDYNEWHHYAMTVDAVDFIFYIDAIEVGRTSNNQSGVYTTSVDHVYIGRRMFSSSLRGFFNGEIDEVRIYDKALSAEEIQQLYQGVFPELVGLEIIGPDEVAEDFQAQYKAIAHYDNSSTADVTDLADWSVEPNTAANIDENGVLRTKDIVTHQSATILASYTEGDVTFEAEKAIDILAICPTGTALQFDGVDDYVMVGDKDSLEPQELTLSFWAQLNNPSGHFQGGIAKGYVFGSPIEFSYRMDFTYGYLRAGITNTENAFFGYFGNFIPVGDNNWHMWTMTVGDSKVFIYKDGFIVGTTGYTGTIDYTKTHNNFVIGARDNGSYAFNGVMDEVAIYNRALSGEEIRANMHTRLTGDELGLVGYWDFDEGEGQIVYDLSGNGNDGQLGVTADVDVSDPAWVESDAPVGICTPYQIATMAVDGAVECKTALLEELLAALAEEWTAYEALQEWLENGDYGDLNKGDIVTAKQKIHSAIQHEGQSIDALEKSIEKLEDALNALGYEPNTAANIDENGVLRTKDIVTHQSATILASYMEGDVTFEAEKAIDILAICPTGTALQFDGVDDYVDLGDIDEFEFGEDDFSISVWIYLGYHSGSGHIITKYYWGNEQRQWYLAHSASDAILFYTNPTGASSDGEKLASVSPVAQNAWAFITAVRKGSTKYIYINGELDTTGTTSGILTGQSAKVYIGVVDSPSEGLHNFFNGKIDDLRIYNRALDANDIQELMHKKLTGDEPGLVGYWDFDEGEGQIVYDLSGNGNDGQLGSTPNPDVSDPAWVESDAPIGICTPYQIATMAVDRAVECKTALLEELLAALAEEWTAYEALEELLESGDYGDLNKGDIVTAKQKIHSATQHQEQTIDALEKSIEKLEDALNALGYEPEPPVPNQPPNVNITNPQDGAVFGSYQTIEIEAYAWDVDGSVVKVEFFANGSKIGEDNDGTDGWKTNWQDRMPDIYYLTAKATDNDGAATTSPAVEITVLEAPLPGQASNPNPANGATGVDRNTNLSWTAGSNAVSHNVYFGTTSPGTFQGNQTVATFDPSSMATYTTYYWRIDEVNPSGTTTGTVWTFRTGGLEPPPG